jgi:hypothetical protein
MIRNAIRHRSCRILYIFYTQVAEKDILLPGYIYGVRFRIYVLYIDNYIHIDS